MEQGRAQVCRRETEKYTQKNAKSRGITVDCRLPTLYPSSDLTMTSNTMVLPRMVFLLQLSFGVFIEF